jgi:hypothetical protein
MAIKVATHPTAQKVVTVEEKWPHSYGHLLLLAKVPSVGNTIFKTIEVLDSLLLAGTSEDTLSEGLAIFAISRPHTRRH